MSKKSKIALLFIPALLVSAYFIADHYLFDGIRPRTVDTNLFIGKYYTTDSTSEATTIVLLGGGTWGEYWSSEFAKTGYSALSLPYLKQKELPDLLEEIPLEYFESAIDWLKEQPEVDPRKIVVMGASRNAELALMVASSFPESVSGVIAISPSSVHWSNTVMPHNSEELKPTWTLGDKALPFLSMDRLQGMDSTHVNTLAYWTMGLNDSAKFTKAQIPVQNINGNILLLSGKDDHVWPSHVMANQIERRLEQYDFPFEFQNIQYEGAGHLISRNPNEIDSSRTGVLNLDGRDYEFSYGGNIESDQVAKWDVKTQVFRFLNNYEFIKNE